MNKNDANVNCKRLALLPIELSPLDEQRRIVSYPDGLQVKINALREELSALRPSILDKAFKGELYLHSNECKLENILRYE